MKKYFAIRLVLLCTAVAAFAGAYHQAATAERMLETANRFVHSLDADQKSQALLEFGSAGRTKWHFVPDNNFKNTYGYGRRGVTYKVMTPKQQRLANALLSTGLSPDGMMKAMTIMSQEEQLRVLEKDTTGRRDVDKYYVSIFGTPSPAGTWGWRVEGHHISLHYTLKGGKLVSAAPTFFGANPHRVEGGFRILGREEDLGRELVKSLSSAQRKSAVVADVAYSDILTKADERAKLENQPRGLAASDMTAAQRTLLMAIIDEYVYTVPAPVAADRMKAVKATADKDLLFAWAGSIEPGAGDYYRVQAPAFLIEYDNTQNNNNHSHLVWRDFAGDFGLDVLAMHHRQNDHGLGNIVAAD